MINQRGKIDIRTTDVVIELHEHDLPRFVSCWARYFMCGGEPVLHSIQVDAARNGEFDNWRILTDRRGIVQQAVDAAVTDKPVNSAAWTAIERAIERTLDVGTYAAVVDGPESTARLDEVADSLSVRD